MKVKGKYSMWAAGALAALFAVGTPAFAQNHGGGHAGGHASMGGGHFSGGGAHFSGGAHMGGAHFAAPHAGAFAGRGFAGAHGAPAFHGTTVTSAGWHGGSHPGWGGHGGWAGHGGGGWAGHGGGWAGHGGWGRPGNGFHHGFWGGGYWHGGFWPRAYYGWGFPWFLPVLPAFYATYWWGGIPYYYANDVYYTWNPTDSGYVVTDPPPTSDNGSADSGAPPPDDGGAPPNSNGGAPPNVNDVYVYPRNGQTEEQQTQDKYECHKWAVTQSGFDPTRGAQASGDPTDYRRALAACLDGRGYSAK